MATVKEEGNPRKHPCGTLTYSSPEMMKDLPNTKSSDVWACGVVIYALVVGHLPFNELDQNLPHASMNNSPLLFNPQDLSNKAVCLRSCKGYGLIRDMLKKEPASRPKADPLLVDSPPMKEEEDVPLIGIKMVKYKRTCCCLP